MFSSKYLNLICCMLMFAVSDSAISHQKERTTKVRSENIPRLYYYYLCLTKQSTGLHSSPPSRTDSDIRIIKHDRKSLLFHDGLPWLKRDSSNAFDVTMGGYDRAEICELVGLFILSTLKDTFGNNIGLYRDDGLVLLDTKSGRLSDKARKDLTHAFKTAWQIGLHEPNPLVSHSSS